MGSVCLPFLLVFSWLGICSALHGVCVLATRSDDVTLPICHVFNKFTLYTNIFLIICTNSIKLISITILICIYLQDNILEALNLDVFIIFTANDSPKTQARQKTTSKIPSQLETIDEFTFSKYKFRLRKTLKQKIAYNRLVRLAYENMNYSTECPYTQC